MRELLYVVLGCAISALMACGGGGGGSTPSVTADASTVTAPSTITVNEVQITVEKWSGNSSFPNQAFVSLEICQPQTNNCQTIPHVLVDTGSYGLRLLSSAVSVPLTQTQVNNSSLAECTHFISGFTWGGVYTADVKLGNQLAPAVPIQLIDGNYAQIPASCSSGGGASMNTQAKLGANGILGIGSFQQDCPGCATRALSAHYYTCASVPCTSTAVALSNQVTNPVALLPTNDNGVVISLPNVDSSGQISAVGTLTFGIDTHSKNAITSETVFKLDESGYFSTTYAGRVYTQSFLDSGSNGLFFPDTSITRCVSSVGFYCPSAGLTKTATISSGTSSTSVSFQVGNAESVSNTYAAQPNLAGLGSTFDWGLPFFYGRKVFVSISGKSTQGGTTPLVAF